MFGPEPWLTGRSFAVREINICTSQSRSFTNMVETGIGNVSVCACVRVFVHPPPPTAVFVVVKASQFKGLPAS